MAERLTRQQLYKLVWSEPLKVLGPKFGISDVALKKTCAKATIPVPERGYWAKLQAGKPCIQPALPPRPPGLADEIVVAGGAYSYWNDHLTEEDILGPLPDPPEFPEPIEALRERVRKEIGKVSVAKTIVHAHPAIARLQQEDERRREKQRSSSYPYSWDAPIFETTFERRRLRILNGLFLAVARMGAKASTRGREAREIGITVGHQHVGLRLDRPSIQRRGRSVPADPSTDKLQLAILASYGSNEPRHAWQDDAGGRLEDLLAEIAIELIVSGELQYRERCVRLHEWRVERKVQLEEETRKRKAEAERRERERLAQLEKERIDRLLSEATSLRQANDIRTYVSTVKTAVGSSSEFTLEELERWCTWALAQADRIDPIKSRAFLKKSETEAEDSSTG